jgi:transcriptional regulator with XRE-family HTH domain
VLGARLKAHYESAGISQKELADRFKTKQSWISRIYSGEFTIRSKIAKKLCEDAGLPFLREASAQNDDNSKIYAIAAELAHLRTSDVQAINKLLKVLKKMN